MKYLKYLFVTFVLVSSTLSAQALDENNDAKILFNEGLQLNKSGNYDGAIKKFDEAINIVKDYRLDFNKAQSYRKLRNFEKAIESYEAAIKLNPDYYPNYFYIGSSFYALKNYDKAKEYFAITIEKTSNKKIVNSCNSNIKKCNEKIAYPILMKANTSNQNGEYKKAVAGFEEVLSYYNSDGAYLGLANAYNELGNYKKAIENASKAIAYRKSIPAGGPYYQLGLAYKNLGDKDAAIQNFESCIKDSKKANKLFRERAKFELKQLKK